MEITTRDLWTVFHGLGFGALFMLAFSGAVAELYRLSAPGVPAQLGAQERNLLNFHLAAMVVLAWLTVLTGAYIVYPWYRAAPPAGSPRERAPPAPAAPRAQASRFHDRG